MGAGHPRSSQVLHGVLNVRAFDDLTVLVTRRSISFHCVVPVLCCGCFWLKAGQPHKIGSRSMPTRVVLRQPWCCVAAARRAPRLSVIITGAAALQCLARLAETRMLSRKMGWS